MTKKKSKPNQTDTPRQDAISTAWEKFRTLIPADEIDTAQAHFSEPLYPAFRFNPLKTNAVAIERAAQRYGWDLRSVPFCAEGRRVVSAQVLPSQTIEHRTGYFYIMDSASMLPCVLFDADTFQNMPLVLDLAASPGGKTTHLIARTQDRGLILANDASISRIPALKSVLKTWGSLNHAVSNFPGENFGVWFPDTFDAVLIDAPCSMQSLVSQDSHPMRPITEREEKALAQRQTALLDSALRALKPGAQAVYSTCTLSPDENEAVIDAMLKKYGALIEVEDASKCLPYPAPGLTETVDTFFDATLHGTVRLWPHRYETAGFFAAVLRKKDSFETVCTPPPFRSWEKSSFLPLDRLFGQEVEDWFMRTFSCSLSELIADSYCVLQRRGDEVWAVPLRCMEVFSAFPLKTTGLRIARRTVSGWMPDHDFVARFFLRLHPHCQVLSPIDEKSWLQGADLHVDEGIPYAKNRILVMTDRFGNYLGCGKLSGQRIRNLNKSG